MVSIIVVETAVPYAPARRSELRKADHERDGQDHHRPVHGRNINLAVFFARCLSDFDAGKPAELHGLACQ